MTNFEALAPGTSSVAGIGNTMLEVNGKGDTQVISTVDGKTLKDVIKSVLYVPDLGTNLFSIGLATRSGSEADFKNSIVTFTRNGRVELQGQRADCTLYHLNLVAQKSLSTPISLDLTEMAFAVNKAESLPVWHHRFAHLNYTSILKMTSTDSIDGLRSTANSIDPSEPCYGCMLGKMHRHPNTDVLERMRLDS